MRSNRFVIELDRLLELALVLQGFSIVLRRTPDQVKNSLTVLIFTIAKIEVCLFATALAMAWSVKSVYIFVSSIFERWAVTVGAVHISRWDSQGWASEAVLGLAVARVMIRCLRGLLPKCIDLLKKVPFKQLTRLLKMATRPTIFCHLSIKTNLNDRNHKQIIYKLFVRIL